jgi:hypothetical protein
MPTPTPLLVPVTIAIFPSSAPTRKTINHSMFCRSGFG